MKSHRLDSGRNRARRRAVCIKKHVPKISRRGKTNHSDWNAQEISVENPTSEMAPPWKLKKDDKDSLSTAMEL
jgi:hypothetical protein